MKVLKLLSVLLDYPRDEIWQHRDELLEAADGGELGPARRAQLVAFVDGLLRHDPMSAQERWLGLFDRGRSMSLLLFEHVHGESRDRGMAMVELKEMYANAGYALAAGELPDYLPVVLEYLSCRDPGEAHAMLGDCAHVLRSIGEALVRRGSAYAAVFDALLAFAREPGLDWSATREAPAPEPSFDEDWAEEPAFAPAAPGRAGGVPASAPIQFVPRKPAA